MPGKLHLCLEADRCERTWKHSAALSEGLSNGAEAQDDMQVGAHTLQEVGVQRLSSLPCTCLLGRSPHLVQHSCQLIFGEQVGHLAYNSKPCASALDSVSHSAQPSCVPTSKAMCLVVEISLVAELEHTEGQILRKKFTVMSNVTICKSSLRLPQLYQA